MLNGLDVNMGAAEGGQISVRERQSEGPTAPSQHCGVEHVRSASSASMTNSLPRDLYIPIEVCEQIIDFAAIVKNETYVTEVANSLLRLAACAIVCRSWLPRSRYHLYRNPVLGGRSQNSPFIDTIRQFQDILPTAVTHMSLVPAVDREDADGISNCGLIRYQERGFHIIPLLLANQKHYTSTIANLTLRSYDTRTGDRKDDSMCHPNFLMACRKTFSSVTTLRLVSLRLSSFSFLSHLLSSFHSLQSLLVEGVTYSKRDQHVVQHSRNKKIRLRQLTIQVTDLPTYIIRWFLRTCTPRSLKSLFLRLRKGDEPNIFIPALQRLLDQASESLELFRLEAWNGDFHDDLTPLSLHSLDGLRTLSLDFTSTQGVPDLLQTIPTKHKIESITLTFGGASTKDTDPVDNVYSILDALVSKTSPALKELSIKFYFAREWVTRGSSGRRLTSRTSLRDAMIKRSQPIRQILAQRGGQLRLHAMESHIGFVDAAVTDDDELSDDESSGNFDDGALSGVRYEKLNRWFKSYVVTRRDQVAEGVLDPEANLPVSTSTTMR